VTAPYDGKVVERVVNRHESVGQDQELMSVIAMGAPKVRLVVPSDWIAWLARGARFELRVDETGAAHTAIVEAIGARIDPVSQTVQVFARFAQAAPGLVPGMSGTARFRPDKES
jgi:multidrug efflux pump subunit AcrA (membrane-fusion protein)